MGYDFEALEDGEITMILNNHDSTNYPNDRQRQTFTVRKGMKYSWDQTGVSIEER